MQNFSEFQCRSQTDWQHFTQAMQDALSDDTCCDERKVDRTDRWTSRSWVACCVCTMQAWQEERVQAYITHHPAAVADASDLRKCCFSNPPAVADLLSPERYICTWPSVPEHEIKAWAVRVTFRRKDDTSQPEFPRLLLLHSEG